MMNRSSSYFHPKKNYNVFFDLDDEEKNRDNNKNDENELRYNQYNYFQQNKNLNSFIPNTINRNIFLKSRFLNSYDNNNDLNY